MQDEWWPCRSAVRWEGYAALVARRSRKSGEKKKTWPGWREAGRVNKVRRRLSLTSYSTSYFHSVVKAKGAHNFSLREARIRF